ncbi:HAD hydrolase-like protein [Mycobacterium sp. 21AC1]|uniref:HAD family hydrolase n=1 Tax=[Mycobacterium] appelbergii TaxID=2939269 RepID=UPI002938EEE0|nr:HAD family hydrolase [Mycobacterium sp. 21AC1]MDV3127508.1 HAD hydrolase-like protein [Mycobacterium sp. 21AC1]
MTTPQEKTWRAGRFWWDCPQPGDARAFPLRAVIFDLDALSDVDTDGHRVVFNAAFAALGLPIEWSVARYRQLLTLHDQRQRVTAELRKRCVGTECDVLAELLADEICMTKEMMFEEMILDAGLAPRPGLVDLVMDAYAADVPVSVVSSGRRSWVEPLVRQLVGEGLVETVVTADDVSPDAELYRHALGELGVAAHDALAVTGSAAGLRAANATGLATVLIDPDAADGRNRPAAAVRADYAGADDALRLATCQRLHAQWWAQHSTSAA